MAKEITMEERIKQYQKAEYKKQRAKLEVLLDKLYDVNAEISKTMEVMKFMEQTIND